MASSPPNPVNSAWSPGDAAVGAKVTSTPQIFSRPVIMQQGLATGINGASPPLVTAPGTAGPGTAVTNNTGYDCMVYMSATTGISKVVVSGVPGGTIGAGAGGTAPALVTLPVYWPNNTAMAVTYTGTLTWTWLAI
jgi:hypothetical protein